MSKISDSEQPINPLFAILIFLASFLTFAVEPLFSKLLLPVFGGSAMVWTTCSLFFQVLLLLSYSYIFILEKLTWKIQRFTYIFAALVIILASSTHIFGVKLSLTELPSLLNTLTNGDEVLNIVTVGMLSMGTAFFFLGTISTSIQVLATRQKIKNPYILYRASNIGSFMGLFSFPLILEPFFTSNELLKMWSGMALMVTCCVGLLYVATNKKVTAVTTPTISKNPTLKEVMTWSLLAAFPVALLLAATNQITLGVAPIPYLWILPLGAYLLGYIIAFGIYKPEALLILLLVSINFAGLLSLIENKTTVTSYLLQVLTLLSITGISSLLFHSKAYSLRPEKSKLSYFYLSLAFGGTIGGFLVSIVAPLVFKDYFELELLLIVGTLYALIQYSKQIPLKLQIFSKTKKISMKILSGITALVFTTFIFNRVFTSYTDHKIYHSRNFYGSLSVSENSGERTLANGNIVHGTQFMGERANIPTTYYSQESGIGKSLEFFKKKRGNEPLRMGVIGLGTGSLASYCQPKDLYVFFEINEQVITVAKKYFSYLDHCQNTTIILGDARTQLSIQNPQSESEKYDLLAIDAFTDDAIPTHLLTVEAGELYLQKIKSDGALLFHVSNRYLDLEKVLVGFAEKEKLISKRLLHTPKNSSSGEVISHWILITKSVEVAAAISESFELDPVPPRPVIWTDNYSNMLRVIKLTE